MYRKGIQIFLTSIEKNQKDVFKNKFIKKVGNKITAINKEKINLVVQVDYDWKMNRYSYKEYSNSNLQAEITIECTCGLDYPIWHKYHPEDQQPRYSVAESLFLGVSPRYTETIPEELH